MNLNELFFFKVFQCLKDTNNNKLNSNHKEDKCYFYHVSISYENGVKKIIEKDRRREQISFTTFFKKIQSNLNEENYNLSINTIFEFKKENIFLNYYIDSLPIKSSNEVIYFDTDYCQNETEFFYHINRYKKNICRFYKSSGKCKKKFCFCQHVNIKKENDKNKNVENVNDKDNKNENIDIDEGIINFRNIINIWLERKEIQLKEIIETYNYILSFENNYLSDLQKEETKKWFSPFLKWYNLIKNTNDNTANNNPNINYLNIAQYKNEENHSNERIIQDIFNQLNPNNNYSKIYKNNNLFESLNISTNVCFISKFDAIKKGEISKYIYAMLNSSDGVIIYGGNENEKSIKGISLKSKERDNFQKWFNTEFLKILIQYDNNIKYKFYDLANNNNDECVLVINVKQIKPNKLLRAISTQQCFIIKEDFLNNIKEQKNVILNEEDVVELNTKEYIELLRKRLLEHYSNKFGVKLNMN